MKLMIFSKIYYIQLRNISVKLSIKKYRGHLILKLDFIFLLNSLLTSYLFKTIFQLYNISSIIYSREVITRNMKLMKEKEAKEAKEAKIAKDAVKEETTNTAVKEERYLFSFINDFNYFLIDCH